MATPSTTRVAQSLRAVLSVGATYAAAHHIDFDAELYYVAALLHDIALTEPFDSHRLRSRWPGRSAWVFGVAAGWPSARADRAAEIIVLHMRDDVAAADDPKPTCSRSRRRGTSSAGGPRSSRPRCEPRSWRKLPRGESSVPGSPSASKTRPSASWPPRPRLPRQRRRFADRRQPLDSWDR